MENVSKKKKKKKFSSHFAKNKTFLFAAAINFRLYTEKV